MEIRDGVGVLPGRYAGPAIRLHSGPTPQQVALAEERAYADRLAGRICAAAALSAQSECQLLELLGEFDAINAVRWWTDVKSLAHWLSWSCSMSPGAARERVRVAKTLRRMPTVLEEFRAGRLSYSKVREVTRVVDVVDEAKLCQLALTATASQLARMIAGFRTANGMRIGQEPKRTVSWQTRDDGMVDFRGRLPKEEAAILIAALTAAKDQFGAPPEAPQRPKLALQSSAAAEEAEVGQVATDAGGPAEPDTQASSYTFADALVDVARVFLDTAPEDKSGEDRTLVVVHVSAENLSAAGAQDAPAGTSESDKGDPTCHIAGVGPIEPETARKLACDADVLGAIVDRHGNVLALGRTRRLVSRALRRALMIRDRMCQFPGCHQTRHLQAHYRVSWADGGPTDLNNLILLCQWHHTAVHEGGMSIRPASGGGAWIRWEFVMPDGTSHKPWYTDERLPFVLADELGRQRTQHAAVLNAVTGFEHPHARTIRPGWTGERFDLHACVQGLFTMRLPDQDQEAA